MQLSRHHFRCLYIIATTGTTAQIKGRHHKSLDLLKQHGFLMATENITHCSPLGYETIGWQTIEPTADRHNVPQFAHMWMPGPNFQWLSLL